MTYLDLSKLGVGEEGETLASDEIWLTVDVEDPNAKGFLSTSSEEEECAMGRQQLSKFHLNAIILDKDVLPRLCSMQGRRSRTRYRF